MRLCGPVKTVVDDDFVRPVAATDNDEIVADLMTFFEEWLFSHFEFHYAPVRRRPDAATVLNPC